MGTGQPSFWPINARLLPNRSAYAVYLGTPQWKARRMEVLELQRYRCADCGSRARLQVHHCRGYANVGDELPSDLVGVCEKCHRRRHEDCT